MLHRDSIPVSNPYVSVGVLMAPGLQVSTWFFFFTLCYCVKSPASKSLLPFTPNQISQLNEELTLSLGFFFFFFNDKHAVWDENGHPQISGEWGLYLVFYSPSANLVPGSRCLVFSDKGHWCFPVLNLVADMCSKLIIVKNVTLWYILTFPQTKSCSHKGKTL